MPSHDDRHLFEMLVLEGFQAGLSWITILKKRNAFKKAFVNWDVKKVAAFDAADIERCMNDAGIVRNRLKINAAIANAKAFIAVKKEFGSFDSYIWKYTGGKTLEVKTIYRELKDVPCQTRESEVMSKELIKRGFKFVGPVVCYSFMQAVGMVNDHVAGCWRNQRIPELQK